MLSVKDMEHCADDIRPAALLQHALAEPPDGVDRYPAVPMSLRWMAGLIQLGVRAGRCDCLSSSTGNTAKVMACHLRSLARQARSPGPSPV
jgi:hypothetical protein